MKSIQSIIAKPETLTFVDSQCKNWVVRNWWCAIDTNLPICTIHIDRHIRCIVMEYFFIENGILREAGKRGESIHPFELLEIDYIWRRARANTRTRTVDSRRC